MTENKQFKIEFDGHKYFHVVDIVNERCVARLDTMADARVLLVIYEMLFDENEQLKKENQGIQDKVMRLLDYVELKQCVTRTEIKKWWNGDVK